MALRYSMARLRTGYEPISYPAYKFAAIPGFRTSPPTFPPAKLPSKSNCQSETKLSLNKARAGIKMALMCDKDSGFEVIQGFLAHVPEIARAVGKTNSLHLLFPRVLMLMEKDVEEVVLGAIGVLPCLCRAAISAEGYHREIEGVVLHGLMKKSQLLNKRISAKAMDALVTIGLMLCKERLLASVSQLALDQEDDESRAVAVQLLAKIAEKSNNDDLLFATFVRPLFSRLAEETSPKVSRAVAESIGQIFRTAKDDKRGILEAFIRLTEARNVVVKRTAAERLAEVSAQVSSDLRLNKLVPVFSRLLTESMQAIRNVSFQHLPEFIATFDPGTVPEILLETLATKAATPAFIITENFATIFPDIVRACGTDGWKSLKPFFISLWDLGKDNDQIISAASCRLGELINILGPEIVKNDVVPVLLGHVQDKGGYVKHILEELNKVPGIALIPLLSRISAGSEKKWRTREKIARNMGFYANSATKSEEYRLIWELSKELCCDAACAVRGAMAGEMWKVIKRMSECWDKRLIEKDICLMGESNKWSERQIYATMCGGLWNSPEILVAMFAGKARKLAKDRVLGVRLALAEALEKDKNRDVVREDPELAAAYGILAADPAVSKLRGAGSEVIQEAKNVEEDEDEEITEEEAAKINLAQIQAEVAAEKAIMVAKKPLDIKIDELDR